MWITCLAQIWSISIRIFSAFHSWNISWMLFKSFELIPGTNDQVSSKSWCLFAVNMTVTQYTRSLNGISLLIEKSVYLCMYSKLVINLHQVCTQLVHKIFKVALYFPDRLHNAALFYWNLALNCIGIWACNLHLESKCLEINSLVIVLISIHENWQQDNFTFHWL